MNIWRGRDDEGIRVILRRLLCAVLAVGMVILYTPQAAFAAGTADQTAAE